MTRPQHRPARGRRTTLGATSPAMPIQSLGHRRPCAAAAPVSRWRIQCSRCIDAGRHAPHDEARRAQWVQVGGARGLKLREAGVCRRCLVSPINRSFVRSFVSNVVVWKTILYDPAAKLCSLSASGRSSRRVAPTTTTRSAPPCELPSKRQRWRCSVQTAVRPGGAIDVGGGKTCAAAVPRAYELHDPEFGLAHAPSTRYGEA